MKRFSFFLLPLLLLVLLSAAARGIAEEAGGLPTGSATERHETVRDAAEAIPLTRAVLYSTGVGYFEHRGEIEGNARVRLHFRREEMKDVLKSLILIDAGGGTAEAVVYEPGISAQESLGRLPVRPDRIDSLTALLRSAKGERITIRSDSRYTGRIIAVEEASDKESEGDGGATLTLLDAGTLRSLPLNAISELHFEDPHFSELLERGLTTLRENRNTGRRSMELRFRGEGLREVRIGYVRRVPVWKSSYRMEIGPDSQLYIQGWAAAENTGTSGWRGIDLAFISGNPISFVMDLYTPLYTERPVLEPPAALMTTSPDYEESYAPQAFAEQEASSMAKRSRSYDTSGAQAPRPEPQLSSGAAASRAEGEAAGSLFAYRIRDKVTVPAGSSALLPIVSAEVEGEQLSVLPLDSTTLHPLKSIRLTNSTGLHLAAGPITLFEGGIYAGDARIGELSPGAERLLSYAVDLEARVVKERQSLPAEIVELSIRNGSLIYTRKERRTTRYRLIHSGKEPKRFLIEHPAPSQGWQLVSPEADERSPSAYRFLRRVEPAGDGRSTSLQLEVTEEYPREQRYALSDADPERLRYFLSGGKPGPELRAALERVADMQSEIRSLKRELETVERRIGDLHREQQRIRANMEALSENSSLYKRYVRELSSQEDRLVALEERRSSLREELRRLQERLDAYLNDLEI